MSIENLKTFGKTSHLKRMRGSYWPSVCRPVRGSGWRYRPGQADSAGLHSYSYPTYVPHRPCTL